MTVTPKGLNEGATAGAHVTPESTVSVSETGAIFSSLSVGSSATVVKVHGDIDIRSAPILANYVCARITAVRHLVFDLSDVGFFGIAGLTVFTALDGAAAEAGSTWSLVEGHPVYRLLEAASLEPSVSRFDSVDRALEALPAQ